jgi:hypothetical protein
MRWTERHIQHALTQFFDFRRNICVPNVSYGFARGRGEKDLIIISKAWYVTEIEIKVSATDLRAEVAKRKHSSSTDNLFGTKIRRYYIAAPAGIWRKFEIMCPESLENRVSVALAGTMFDCPENQTAKPVLPRGAGRIELSLNDYGQPGCLITRPSELNKHAQPLNINEMVEVLRLAHFRIWDGNEFAQLFPSEAA